MTKHTPTPWHYDPNHNAVTATPNHRGDGKIVLSGFALTMGHYPTPAANTALIVRAVNAHDELLAALHAIIDLDHHNMGPESRATEIARAALAKADASYPSDN